MVESASSLKSSGSIWSWVFFYKIHFQIIANFSVIGFLSSCFSKADVLSAPFSGLSANNRTKCCQSRRVTLYYCFSICSKSFFHCSNHSFYFSIPTMVTDRAHYMLNESFLTFSCKNCPRIRSYFFWESMFCYVFYQKLYYPIR